MFRNVVLNPDYQSLDKTCAVTDPLSNGKQRPAHILVEEFMHTFAGVCLTSEVEGSHYCHPNVVTILEAWQEVGDKVEVEKSDGEADTNSSSPRPDQDRESVGTVQGGGGGGRRKHYYRRLLVADGAPKNPFPGDTVTRELICGPCKEEAAALVLFMYPPQDDTLGAPTEEGETKLGDNEMEPEVGLVPDPPPKSETPPPKSETGLNASGPASPVNSSGATRRVDREGSVEDGGGGGDQIGGEEGYEEGGLGDYDEEDPRIDPPGIELSLWPDIGLLEEERDAYWKLLQQVRAFCGDRPVGADKEEGVVQPGTGGGGGAEDENAGTDPSSDRDGAGGSDDKSQENDEAVETVTVKMSATLQMAEESFDEAARTTFKAVTAHAFNVPVWRVTITSVVSVPPSMGGRRLLAGGGIKVDTEVKVAKLVADPTAAPLTEAQMDAIQSEMEAELEGLGLKEAWGLDVADMAWKPTEPLIAPESETPTAAAGTAAVAWASVLAGVGVGILGARTSV